MPEAIICCLTELRLHVCCYIAPTHLVALEWNKFAKQGLEKTYLRCKLH